MHQKIQEAESMDILLVMGIKTSVSGTLQKMTAALDLAESRTGAL